MNKYFLKTLEEEIEKCGYDLRIGQVICNALGITCPELYYLTNANFESKLKKSLK